MKKLKTMLIGTHNGAFHADESLACFMLRNTRLFANADIIRTRDPAQLDKCDVVVDVGGIYDPSNHRYDHHQREFQDTMTIGEKKYNTRLSSAGLVYKHFGKEVIANICNMDKEKEKERIDLMFQKIYEDFVEAFDGIDNGINQYPPDIKPKYRDSTGIADRVSRLNPWWNEEVQNVDERFLEAVKITGEEMTQKIRFLAYAWLPAREIVKQALLDRFNVDKSGKIIRLRQSMPWKEHLLNLEEELDIGEKDQVLYVLYPESKDDAKSRWRIQCVPKQLGLFDNRKSLKDEWKGERDDQLSALSGIPGCIFVHASGFIGGNHTFEGALAMAKSITGNRLVIALSNNQLSLFDKEHPSLLKGLKERGYEVSTKDIAQLELFSFGERAFDHLLIFAPEISKWSGELNADKIVEYMGSGGNVFLVLSQASKTVLRELAAEFGIQPDLPGTRVVDADLHTGSDFSQLSVPVKNDFVFGQSVKGKVLYQGLGHSLSPSNALVFPVLSASAAAQSSDKWTTAPEKKAERTKKRLVSALQARNNARFVFSGSTEMFSEKALEENRDFVDALTKWCFQESQVLRVTKSWHHKVNETEQLELYRVKDEVEYEIQVDEYKGDKWQPFQLPSGDKMQLELVMLDPYVRVNLKQKKSGVYGVTLRLPDVYGVFTFKMIYKRHSGYSFIEEKSTVSIVPPRHNEYPRFLMAAYPYYASSFSMMISFYLFVIVYLYVSAGKGEKKKSE